MTKAELLDLVHGKVEGLSKRQVTEIVDAVFDSLAEAIRDSERFSYPGFGTFSVKERAAREGRNPRTGESIQISASKTVGFKPAPKLKDSLKPVGSK
ncbi:MAG: HU family DNA-binding protein [Bradymonadales bacterium]